MKIPRDLSGVRLADVLCDFRVNSNVHQRIAIPDHHPIRLGTLLSIIRAVPSHKATTRDAIIDSL